MEHSRSCSWASAGGFFSALLSLPVLPLLVFGDLLAGLPIEFRANPFIERSDLDGCWRTDIESDGQDRVPTVLAAADLSVTDGGATVHTEAPFYGQSRTSLDR